MPTTRTMAAAAVTSDFEHVTIIVFGQKPESPLLKALEYNAIFNIGAIMALNEQAILRLQYMDDSSEPPTKLPIGWSQK
jgi:hypothetical protein